MTMRIRYGCKRGQKRASYHKSVDIGKIRKFVARNWLQPYNYNLFSIFLSENESSTANPQSSTLMTNVTVENATQNVDYCTVDKTKPSQTDPEHRLLADLTKNYNLDARPILNKSKAIQVLFGLALTQIVELVSRNENEQCSKVCAPIFSVV